MTERATARLAADLSLVFTDAAGQPRIFPVPQGTTTIGRSDDNDLVLPEPSVAPHQVVVLRDGDRIELRDLFSGETRVNDAACRSGPLQAGDVLALGQVRLRLMKVVPRRTAALGPRLSPPDDARADTGRLARPTAALPRPGSGRLARPDLRASTQRVGRASSDTDRHPPPQEAPAPAPEALARAREEGREEARAREAQRERRIARARQLSEEMHTEDDFEVILERVALGFLDVFGADRAVTILFEEDGRNPLLTVERRRDGTDEGTGVAQEIVDRCLQVRTVVRVAGGHQGLGGLAAPLLSRSGKALGMLYFERVTAGGEPLDATDGHLMSMLTNQAAAVLAPLVG